jgi:hypothetical protein
VEGSEASSPAKAGHHVLPVAFDTIEPAHGEAC